MYFDVLQCTIMYFNVLQCTPVYLTELLLNLEIFRYSVPHLAHQKAVKTTSFLLIVMSRPKLALADLAREFALLLCLQVLSLSSS